VNSQQPRVQGVAQTLLSRFSAFLGAKTAESGKKSEGKQVETPPLLAIAWDGTFLWKA